MKIKMLKNCKGANDGIKVVEYIAGQIYELSESLAKAFISMGVAKEALPAPEINMQNAPESEGEVLEEVIENLEEADMQQGAPENKSMKVPGSKKKRGGK